MVGKKFFSLTFWYEWYHPYLFFSFCRILRPEILYISSTDWYIFLQSSSTYSSSYSCNTNILFPIGVAFKKYFMSTLWTSYYVSLSYLSKILPLTPPWFFPTHTPKFVSTYYFNDPLTPICTHYILNFCTINLKLKGYTLLRFCGYRLCALLDLLNTINLRPLHVVTQDRVHSIFF